MTPLLNGAAHRTKDIEITQVPIRHLLGPRCNEIALLWVDYAVILIKNNCISHNPREEWRLQVGESDLMEQTGAYPLLLQRSSNECCERRNEIVIRWCTTRWSLQLTQITQRSSCIVWDNFLATALFENVKTLALLAKFIVSRKCWLTITGLYSWGMSNF